MSRKKDVLSFVQMENKYGLHQYELAQIQDAGHGEIHDPQNKHILKSNCSALKR